MLTPDGQGVLLELLQTWAESATIRVWESEEVSEEVALDDGFPKIEEGEVVFQGTFNGDQANFHWTRHAVVANDRIIDLTEEDLGIKVAGSVWSLRPRVSFAPAPPSAG